MDMVTLQAIVHPIDTDKHPTIPAGFRWCAQLGTDEADPAGWLNAGWAPTESEAAVTGEMVAIAVRNALGRVGVPCDYLGAVVLGDDPIPAEEA